MVLLSSSCSEIPRQTQPTTPKPQQQLSEKERQLLHIQQQIDKSLTYQQPKKNNSLIAILGRVLQSGQRNAQDQELFVAPSDMILEKAGSILTQIDQQVLTPEQENRLIVYRGLMLLFQQQLERATDLLDTKLFQPEQKLLRQYYLLKAYLAEKQSRLWDAITLYIQAYPQLTKTAEKTNSKINHHIWSLLQQFSVDELKQLTKQLENGTWEQELQTKPRQQLAGWLSLMQLIKSEKRLYRINIQLQQWEQNYPEHMANRSFIKEQLNKRFALLLRPKKIAILLPMSGRLQKPAKNILDGIIAAHYQQSIDDQLQINLYDSHTTDIVSRYHQAVSDGAELIIGPFSKKNIAILLENGQITVPTLILNRPDTPTLTLSMPSKLYQFSLNPEDEIIAMLKFARQQGYKNALILAPESKWGLRMQKLFTTHWLKKQGRIIGVQNYDKKSFDFSEPLQNMLELDLSHARKQKLQQVIGQSVNFTPRRRKDIDFIFLAAFFEQARQIPLQISYYYGSDIPVLATSHIIGETGDSQSLKDLQGIFYTDMPWLIRPEIEAISRQGQAKKAFYQRLFSFGVDSYQLIPYLRLMSENAHEIFKGETGTLSLHNGVFKRQTPIAQIQQGNIQLIGNALDTQD